MRVARLVALSTLLALPGSALAQVEDAIAEGSAAWEAGWNAGDAGAIAAVYAEDARLMAPGAEPVQGREAIQAAFEEDLEAAAGTRTSLETVDLMTGDDLVIEIGAYVNTAADGSHLDHGKYIAIWKNVDGEWKIVEDIWNSSM